MFYRQRTKLHRYFTHRPQPQKPWQRFLNVGFSLLTAALMLMVVVLLRDGKVWGKELHPAPSTAQADTLTTLSDGSLVVNTSELGKDIIGYGGPVPLAITIKDDTVRSITALDNSETPDFFAEVKPLLKLWESRSLSEADTLKVDVVSGATYSSRALIDNVRTGVHFLRDYQNTHSWWTQVDFSPKFWASLLVVLLAAPLVGAQPHLSSGSTTAQRVRAGAVDGHIPQLRRLAQLHRQRHQSHRTTRTDHHARHSLCLSTLRQKVLLLLQHLPLWRGPRPDGDTHPAEKSHPPPCYKGAQSLPPTAVGSADALHVDRPMVHLGGIRSLLGLHLRVGLSHRHRDCLCLRVAQPRHPAPLLPLRLPHGHTLQNRTKGISRHRHHHPACPPSPSFAPPESPSGAFQGLLYSGQSVAHQSWA